VALRLFTVGVAVAVLLSVIAMFQDRLLYFPTRATVADLATGELAPWPGAQDFRGLVANPDNGSAPAGLGTVIVFHGNAGHAGHRAFYAQELSRLGLRVILAEYPGYGPREGEPGEERFVADAERTISLAHGRYGDPLVVIGESLGAAVAASAASRQAGLVAGLMLITPWDRLEHVGQHHYPWLPVKWLLRDQYDTLQNLRDFRRPVMVVLAEQDEIVPSRLGAALHAGLEQPKELLVIAGAAHNDWPHRVDTQWWRRAMEFLLPSSSPR
jgi:pimeloyl-ACP methyl ester carboxylesterase